MSPSEPRLQAALDAALSHIRTTVTAVAQRVSDVLGTMSLSATRVAERDQFLAAQFELRRHLPVFQVEFTNALRQRVERETGPRHEGLRKPAATDWQSLSLVEDRQVEEQMVFDRIAQQIEHECEWELRELAPYMGTVTRTGRAAEGSNPLRAEVLGAALYRAIEAVTPQDDLRKLLARELGQTLARAMRNGYAEILRDLKARGVQPVNLSVRQLDGPGHHLPGINSAYQSLPRPEYSSTGGHGDLHDRGPEGSYGGGRSTPSTSHSSHSGLRSPSGHGPGVRSGYAPTDLAGVRADAQLMDLLRRLSAIASRPGDLDAAVRHAGSRSGGYGAELSGGSRGAAVEALSMPMAVNLIRAHRDELLQASSGKLDHMVIDVVGSLFDQILSDPRVPPQMARQIARLQLPVLRVALNDATFFSSRRHPVRRFVNRIASLACAFDDFDDGPGKHFLERVRELIQEIVEGDFDQVPLYTVKLDELERFIAKQTHDEVEQAGTAVTLENKESELLLQQRYMLQLRHAIASLSLPDYMSEFVTQVWSQALLLAVRHDGAQSDRHQRYKLVGRDVIMSLQPKGNPTLRQRFLMRLPSLNKDLKEGLALIGWPEAAQRAFFGRLMPAQADSMKQPALSELDHNLMAKQVEAIFNAAVPGQDAISMTDVVTEVDEAAIAQRFTADEAQQVGLVAPEAVDWSGKIDIELDAAATGADDDEVPTDPMPLKLGADLALDLSSTEPPEPTRGPQLMDHIKLGFAYQMQLKDEWQKVRLTYVSPARSFFVFTHGKRHQETVSMTARMLARMCEGGRLRAVESAYLMERATHRARKQLAALKATTRQ